MSRRNVEEAEEDADGFTRSIDVAVRVRPLLPSEADNGCKSILRVLEERIVVALDPAKLIENNLDYLRLNRSREKRYAFDKAFDESATQEYVYANTVQKLIGAVMTGFNGSVFAYGATGAGKTFTMLGDKRRPGLMVLTVAELFQRIDAMSKDKRYKVNLSYLEVAAPPPPPNAQVYNENIRDLLATSSAYLDLREDPLRGVCVAGITEVVTRTATETMELLHRFHPPPRQLTLAGATPTARSSRRSETRRRRGRTPSCRSSSSSPTAPPTSQTKSKFHPPPLALRRGRWANSPSSTSRVQSARLRPKIAGRGFLRAPTSTVGGGGSANSPKGLC
jgi:hypothetical protein